MIVKGVGYGLWYALPIGGRWVMGRGLVGESQGNQEEELKDGECCICSVSGRIRLRDDGDNEQGEE